MKKTYDFCLRCHRKLKTEESKELGYGKVCYAKANSNNLHKNALFTPVVKKTNV